MDKKTLKALKGSIKKWQDIVKGVGIDKGMNNCPLCIEFNLKFGSCSSCPIYQETECLNCENTPYEDWIEHVRKNHSCSPLRVHCPTCKELAQKELDFLKTFLPIKLDKKTKEC